MSDKKMAQLVVKQVEPGDFVALELVRGRPMPLDVLGEDADVVEQAGRAILTERYGDDVEITLVRPPPHPKAVENLGARVKAREAKARAEAAAKVTAAKAKADADAKAAADAARAVKDAAAKSAPAAAPTRVVVGSTVNLADVGGGGGGAGGGGGGKQAPAPAPDVIVPPAPSTPPAKP